MFNNKRRIRSAWLKGLMFGRALGAKNERERIIELLEEDYDRILDNLGMEYGLKEADILLEILETIRGESND